MKVYVLFYVERDFDVTFDMKGVFETRESAEAAKAAYIREWGKSFRVREDDFEISEVVLNEFDLGV